MAWWSIIAGREAINRFARYSVGRFTETLASDTDALQFINRFVNVFERDLAG
jgi:hypothetical protein